MSEVAPRNPHGEVLDSWKEIAAYLGRDVSTAQRWEHNRGLPVRRIQGGRRGAVYALKSELDDWKFHPGTCMDEEDGEPASPKASPGSQEAVHGWLTWHRMATALAVVAAAALLAWSLTPRSSERSLSFLPLVSLPGQEVCPAFSPDGAHVAFAYMPEGGSDFDLYTKSVGTGEPLRLTNTPDSEIEPHWAPDSSQIAFLRTSGPGLSVWTMGALGGGERRVATLSRRYGLGAGSISWPSPGDSLIVSDRNGDEGPFSLYSLHLATGARHRLTEPPADTIGDSDPASSSDGSMLAFLRQSRSRVTEIWVMPLRGGEPVRITSDQRLIRGLAWAEDDRHLLFVSDRGGPEPALWKVPSVGGRPQSLAVLPAQSRDLAAASGRTGRIAYSRALVRSSIWHYSMDAAAPYENQPRKLITSSRMQAHPQYSPDGESIAFMSDRSGFMEIWVSRSDGSAPRQLTYFRGAEGGAPHWSPDGRVLAFDMRVQGNPDIFLIGAEGGAVRHLVADPSEDGAPSWSRDGRWVYFASNRSGEYQVWKTPASGGPPQQVTRGGGVAAFESPDGGVLYYAKGRNQLGLWKKTLPDGEELPMLPEYALAYFANWQVARPGVYFIDTGNEIGSRSLLVKLWPFGGGPPRVVTTIDESAWKYSGDIAVGVSRYHSLAVSPNLKHLLITQLDQTQSNIMIAESSHWAGSVKAFRLIQR